MNANNKFYFYHKRTPFGFFPFIILGLIIFTLLAAFGLFIAFVVGTAAVGLFLIRLLLPSRRRETKRVEDDGKTIVLREDEYQIIEKKG